MSGTVNDKLDSFIKDYPELAQYPIMFRQFLESLMPMFDTIQLCFWVGFVVLFIWYVLSARRRLNKLEAAVAACGASSCKNCSCCARSSEAFSTATFQIRDIVYSAISAVEAAYDGHNKLSTEAINALTTQSGRAMEELRVVSEAAISGLVSTLEQVPANGGDECPST